MDRLSPGGFNAVFQHGFFYLYNGNYIISAPWQMGLSMGSLIDQVIGAMFTGLRSSPI